MATRNQTRGEPATGRPTYECVESFATWNDAGVPMVWSEGNHVAEDDPILRSHGQFFRPSSERVERMSAGPGEKRNVTIPNPPDQE